MKYLYGLLFLFVFLNLSFCSVINKLNITGFHILDDEKTVELTNPHRTNGKLKFTFEGGNITKVEHNSLLWSFLMSGDANNRVDIHQLGPINSKITTAYEVRWSHVHENISDPEICFEMGFNNASWFSTYLEVDQPWPYNTGKPMAKPVSFNTGSYSSDQLGPVVNNLFFTSDGFALYFDPGYSPKFLQRHPNGRLCFTVKSFHGHAQYADITVAIRLRGIEPIWASLKCMVRNALTMGLANYNFLMAPSFKTPPSEELYIRWLQAITFFPSIQLANAPWKISDKAANLTSTFLALRANHVATVIAEAKRSAIDGSPLLRPLWYLAPEDSRTYAIDDQFALGNDLIVAPVLTQGQTQRTVYLSTGKWIDAHGKLYTGPGSFTVQAPLEELPYFKRHL